MSNRTKKTSIPFGWGVVLAVISICVCLIVQFVAKVQFDRKYLGHLKRASDANSLELAERELSIALNYAKSRQLDTEVGRSQGWYDDYTDILYTSPENQISFHIENVEACLHDVQEVRARGDQASPMERSNVLMKLRESLLDDSQSGHDVTCPGGLYLYPHNFGYAVWIGITALVGGICGIGYSVKKTN